MTTYELEFRSYRRKFLYPLQTSHGKWETRCGIILRLTDEVGRISWGEIAPISWFGSESLEQALIFCQQLPKQITEEVIFSIPDELPACQFGFESASSAVQSVNLSVCGLLPAGKAALDTWQKLFQKGYTTFKWKIGVYSCVEELEILHSLVQVLPPSVKIRLDGNGGLNYEEASLWLLNCDNINSDEKLSLEIEYLEQPLSPCQLPQMLELSYGYKTPIALDESVATVRQLMATYAQGWRGIFVIKPGIAGSPLRLRQFCLTYKIDAVFSSVFETVIGRQAAVQLAALSNCKRAVGFGVNHLFTEVEENPQKLWNKLPY